MRDVLDEVTAWNQRGDRIALATVVDVRRSARGAPGAKMAVNERGEIAGGVSGGCVEGAVVEIAERVIDGGGPELATFGIADDEAWGGGLPWGGGIRVWVDRPSRSRFLELQGAGRRAVEVTALEGEGAGKKL